MAAAPPFFIQADTGRAYCSADQLNDRTKTEPRDVDEQEDLSVLLGGLRDAAGVRRRTLVDNHHSVDMLAADRDPICPPTIDLAQHIQAVYRSPTMDNYTAGNVDNYYHRAVPSDFGTAGYGHHQYPTAASLITNGYCRSMYADKCAQRRYESAESSYFHSGGSAVQPAWAARLPVVGGGAFPFPVEFGSAPASNGRHEYRQVAVPPSGDCCRTDLVSERSSAFGCSQTPVDGVAQRRRSTVGNRSPPLRGASTSSSSCCRLDSTDGGTSGDRLAPPTPGDELGTNTSSPPSSKSTPTTSSSIAATAPSAPVVVYPWMRKLHGRSSSNHGQSIDIQQNYAGFLFYATCNEPKRF